MKSIEADDTMPARGKVPRSRAAHGTESDDGDIK